MRNIRTHLTITSLLLPRPLGKLMPTLAVGLAGHGDTELPHQTPKGLLVHTGHFGGVENSVLCLLKTEQNLFPGQLDSGASDFRL